LQDSQCRALPDVFLGLQIARDDGAVAIENRGDLPGPSCSVNLFKAFGQNAGAQTY
jgi:hypothetical protein